VTGPAVVRPGFSPEPAGLREFLLARRGALLRSAWMLTGGWHQAEDLLQAALVKVWPRWEQVAAQGDPEPYLRRVLVTTYVSQRRLRRNAEEPFAELGGGSGTGAPVGQPDGTAAPGSDGTAALEAVELRDLLRRLLPGLPPRQRAVLVLRFYEDLSVEETAAVLNCSAGTVKSQTAKALARLHPDRSRISTPATDPDGRSQTP
jgi:RNA polymerase sigma-70 factor (sigma-E family)